MDQYSLKIAASCFVGVILSIYAFHVEMKAEQNDEYEAMCDINQHISCTKVFASEYGRGFGVIGKIFGDESILNQPNSIAGIIFYLLVGSLGILQSQRSAKQQLIFSLVSVLLSVYLAYLLYFVLEDLCVVCVSTYAVNIFNLYYSFKRYRFYCKKVKVN